MDSRSSGDPMLRSAKQGENIDRVAMQNENQNNASAEAQSI
jgi:hypothetical protein